MSEPILDRQAALNFVRHDYGILRDLVETFREYYPSVLDRISKAIELQDAGDLHEAAHQLKGAVSNFHARAAFDTTYALELKGHNAELGGARSLHDSLTRDVETLYASLVELLDEIVPRR